uniref:Chorismate lyase n=1 Tax=Strigomonas oncopelti TaxID=5657 RepID=T1YUL5_STROO|nr:chorismate lyase [Strigomonas oncopelti]
MTQIWKTEEALTTLTPTEARWLFSSGSLTVQLKALSAAVAPVPAGSPPAFTVRVIAEGWQKLSADELAALRWPAAAGTRGWAREVHLCGAGGTCWIAARTVVPQTPPEGAAAARAPAMLQTLGDRPLGSVLFQPDSPFARGPISVAQTTEGALLRLRGGAEDAAPLCWTRRSLFRDDTHDVSVLVAELFTSALWSAVAKAEEQG